MDKTEKVPDEGAADLGGGMNLEDGEGEDFLQVGPTMMELRDDFDDVK